MNASPAAALSANLGPCPGPIAKSAAHAERCRACGRCKITWNFAQGEAGTPDASRTISTALAFAVE